MIDLVFLDANVLFSAAYRPNAGLLQLWKLKNATLCSSRYALEEARNNIHNKDQLRRLMHLVQGIQIVEAGRSLLSSEIPLPEKDRPILLAAIAARATHLLTGDVRHFGPYFGKTIGGVTIMLPADYLRMRASHR